MNSRKPVLLPILVCLSLAVQAEEETSVGDRLIAAASSGDLPAVLVLTDSHAYVPGSMNAMKAIRAAKANGHSEVVVALEDELDEYFQSGAPYEALSESFLKKMNETLREKPDFLETFDWKLDRDMTVGFSEGLYRRISADPENLLCPRRGDSTARRSGSTSPSSPKNWPKNLGATIGAAGEADGARTGPLRPHVSADAGMGFLFPRDRYANRGAGH